MKKIAVVAASAAALILAACTNTKEDFSAKVTEAQAYAATACNIVPVADALLEIFQNGKYETARTVGKMVCDAWLAKKAAPQTLFGFGEKAEETECPGVVVDDICVPVKPVEPVEPDSDPDVMEPGAK